MPFDVYLVLNFIYYYSLHIRVVIRKLLIQLFSHIHFLRYVIVLFRLMKPWLHFDRMFALTPTGRLQKKTLKNLHEFIEKVRKNQVAKYPLSS